MKKRTFLFALGIGAFLQTISAFPGHREKTNLNEEYRGYDLTAITQGLSTDRKVKPYSLLDPKTIDLLMEAYLDAHPQPTFRKLREYFDHVFPTGKPLPKMDPLYLNPEALRNFEGVDRADGLPPRITIEEASKAIHRLIKYAEDGEPTQKQNASFVLATRYYMKRLLVSLESNPEKIGNALVVLSSVGIHCRTERTAGLTLLEEMLGDDGSILFTSPKTISQHLGYALDQLREKIFRQALQFNDPKVEPAHTQIYYRQLTHQLLGVAPGIKDPARKAKSNYYAVISVEEFLKRFFDGKISSRSWLANSESRRSHPGYTPEVITRAVIDYIIENPAAFGFQELVEFFSPSIGTLELYAWASSHRNEILKIFLIDDLKTPQEKQEFIDLVPAHDLKSAFVNANFTETYKQEGSPGASRTRPNACSIRLMLLLTEHLESRTYH